MVCQPSGLGDEALQRPLGHIDLSAAVSEGNTQPRHSVVQISHHLPHDARLDRAIAPGLGEFEQCSGCGGGGAFIGL